VSALRILHVDTGTGWRGGQAQVDLLVRALAARGHVQAVATPAGSPLARRLATAGDACTLVPFAPRADLDVAAALGLVGPALRFGPDALHMHDARAHATAWLAARAARCRSVVSRRVALAATGRRPHAWKYRTLRADRWHAISGAVKDELVALGVEAGRIAVVPDALDVAAVSQRLEAARAEGQAATLRAAWGGTPGRPLWGVIAALTPEKGHAVLLDAFANADVPDARLVLVGAGPGEGRLRARVDALGLASRVTWAGPVDDVVPALAALDALVVPSRAEGFGSIVLLAQAAGLPVVASAVGGLVEAIEDGVTGRLVPGGDPAALAAALEELARDPATARERALRARAGLGRFDVAGIAARIEELYRG
jgi:glycosyltransferase involved in cell wall biosynthesis